MTEFLNKILWTPTKIQVFSPPKQTAKHKPAGLKTPKKDKPQYNNKVIFFF